MRALLTRLVLWFGLLAAAISSNAEDVDLFTASSLSTNALPNVLIIVDNTANWNTQFTAEMSALSTTLSGLTVDKFRVGVMLYTETGSGNTNTDGAYVRAAVRTMNSANKTKYQALVNGFAKVGDKSNGGKASLAMAEAYRYYAAAAPYAGNGKAKTDYAGNTSGTTADTAVYALSGNALSGKTSTSYVSPTSTSSCGNNYIIYISNGNPAENTSDLGTASDMLTAAGGDSTTITSGITTSASKDSKFDEWAKFMKSTSSLGISTYTVDVDRVTTGQGPAWTQQLQSAARVGGGRYFDVSSASGTSSAGIADALKTIFSEIQAVNSVFASASLPVSVNTQGSYLNQIFVGQFRPAADSLPRWWGNMKQYKLALTGNELGLVDADGTDAIDATTGFIQGCARSYWTPTALDKYWDNFGMKQTCSTQSYSGISNYPDGNVVEKGAQAYLLRKDASVATGSKPRVVKTCASVLCTTLLDFNTTNASLTALGISDSTLQSKMVNWVLGMDMQDEDADVTTSAEMRHSAHGDVVHSRPVAVNYGTDSSPKVVVFYGGNDGMLRAVNGNRTASMTSSGSTTYDAGQELWSFLPPEFLSKVKRLYNNSPRVYVPGTADTTATRKEYGMDGSLSVYQSGSSTWLYAGMRRGGRSLYSFDVSDPFVPSLKWRLGCPSGSLSDDTNCSTGMTGLGQTWATPSPVIWKGSTTPVLLMGGGYDTCEDSDPHTCTSSSKGRAVYILNASTGAVLKTLGTLRSVVGDVAMVFNTSGKVTYAYASDTGGNLYRITPVNEAGSDWTITQIASLGCATPSSACTANRKFLFGPDVVAGLGNVNYVLVGSGDREKPLLSYTTASSVVNYMFMVRDKPTAADWLSSQNSTCGANLMCLASLSAITVDGDTPSDEALTASRGWALAMRSTEQVVTSSITSAGTTTFSTHTPAISSATSSSCSPSLGVARVYNVKYRSAGLPLGATSRSATVAGGGLSPSPVAGKIILDDGTVVNFVIGASADSPLQARKRTTTASTINSNKVRVYQYIER